MSDFKKLKVWQKSIKLVSQIYLHTTKFPKEETFGITSQIRQSAISIPSNISEGAGRKTKKDFSHFLDIAKGSSFELETQLIIAKELNYLNDSDFNEISKELEEIQKMIVGFQKNLNQTIN